MLKIQKHLILLMAIYVTDSRAHHLINNKPREIDNVVDVKCSQTRWFHASVHSYLLLWIRLQNPE